MPEGRLARKHAHSLPVRQLCRRNRLYLSRVRLIIGLPVEALAEILADNCRGMVLAALDEYARIELIPADDGGYADPDFAANRLHVRRDAVEKNVIFLGGDSEAAKQRRQS